MKMNLLLESSFSWLWSNSLILRVSVTAQGRDTRGWREAGSPFSPEPHITLALALPSQGRRCTRGSELSGSSDAVAGTLWYPGREGFMVQSWGGSLLAQLSRVHIQPGRSFPPMPAQTGFWLRLQHLQFDIFFYFLFFKVLSPDTAFEDALTATGNRLSKHVKTGTQQGSQSKLFLRICAYHAFLSKLFN